MTIDDKIERTDGIHIRNEMQITLSEYKLNKIPYETVLERTEEYTARGINESLLTNFIHRHKDIYNDKIGWKDDE